MKRCITSSRRATRALMATGIIALSGSVFAQSVDQVLQADQRRLTLAQQSQERINEIVEGTRSLEDQYRAIGKEIDGLRVYNELMRAQTNGQQAMLDDIALSMDQVDVINRQIVPLMMRMIDGLEQSIALDVPFLMEERTERVGRLRSIMERSDVPVSEKFRNVLEAYQIELDYGNWLEAYEGRLGTGADARTVEFVQLGRVSLMYRTLDGSEAGYWDANQKTWVVDPSYRDAIEAAVRIAKGDDPPDLLTVPVPAPQEVRS